MRAAIKLGSLKRKFRSLRILMGIRYNKQPYNNLIRNLMFHLHPNLSLGHLLLKVPAHSVLIHLNSYENVLCCSQRFSHAMNVLAHEEKKESVDRMSVHWEQKYGRILLHANEMDTSNLLICGLVCIWK